MNINVTHDILFFFFTPNRLRIIYDDFDTYRVVESMCTSSPSFFQMTIGSGWPLGGLHSNRAVCPWATFVSFGSTRNSSFNTVKCTETHNIRVLNSDKGRITLSEISIVERYSRVTNRCRRTRAHANHEAHLYHGDVYGRRVPRA